MVVFQHFLPSIAVPAVLAHLDISAARATQLLAELGAESAA
ncbi:hypothetical protein [Streptomyces olindensis]